LLRRHTRTGAGDTQLLQSKNERERVLVCINVHFLRAPPIRNIYQQQQYEVTERACRLMLPVMRWQVKLASITTNRQGLAHLLLQRLPQ
jgi:hypothetical protein